MDLEEEGIGRRDHLEVRTVQEGVIQSRREFLRHFQAADLVQRVVQEPTLQVLLNSKDVSNIPRWLDSVSEEPPVLDMAKVAPEMAKIVARNFEEVLICCADSENFEPSSLLQTISQRKNKNKVMKEELHHLKVRQAELLRAIIKVKC